MWCGGRCSHRQIHHRRNLTFPTPTRMRHTRSRFRRSRMVSLRPVPSRNWRSERRAIDGRRALCMHCPWILLSQRIDGFLLTSPSRVTPIGGGVSHATYSSSLKQSPQKSKRKTSTNVQTTADLTPRAPLPMFNKSNSPQPKANREATSHLKAEPNKVKSEATAKQCGLLR